MRRTDRFCAKAHAQSTAEGFCDFLRGQRSRADIVKSDISSVCTSGLRVLFFKQLIREEPSAPHCLPLPSPTLHSPAPPRRPFHLNSCSNFSSFRCFAINPPLSPLPSSLLQLSSISPPLTPPPLLLLSVFCPLLSVT